MKMSRFQSDRVQGPEFDNRLIQLVRANPIIYDINHPQYRRNPVRTAIWEQIAAELGAPSKYLQTKWKNIRYNYLQEIKSLRTGTPNPHIRKRRFTEDLSFLQVYTKKIKLNSSSLNASDNDSNSYMCSDAGPQDPNEIIEIENSEDSFQDDCEESSNQIEEKVNYMRGSDNLWDEDDDRVSPPLLAPLVSLNEDNNDKMPFVNGEFQEETIKRPTEIIANASKRKSMPAPFPVLTPINDPIELYCLSLVDSLRNMPRSELERVKYEFAKILKDAKYKDDC